jgi:hypothetical protein
MKRLIFTLPLLALAACTSVPTDAAAWPAGVPARDYYERAYDADPANAAVQTKEDYLSWVGKFYFGNGLVAGWFKTSSDISKDLEPRQRVLVEPKLAYLGQLISSEWSKHNKTRRVTSEMLQLWGSVMTKAKSEKRIEPAIDRLLDDARGLVTGEVEKKAIRTTRYKDLLASSAPSSPETPK